jgi:hypothetical protein
MQYGRASPVTGLVGDLQGWSRILSMRFSVLESQEGILMYSWLKEVMSLSISGRGDKAGEDVGIASCLLSTMHHMARRCS